MIRFRPLACWLSSGILLLLAGCGGGDNRDAPPPTVSPAAVSVVAPHTPDKRAAAATPQAFSGNGWYWNPAEAGTGFMVEAQGSRGFVAFFMYEEGSGRPIWYAAYGDIAAGATSGTSTFNGELRSYRGGQAAASSAYRPPTSSPIGTVTIAFGPGTASVALPGGRQMAAQRYRIDGSNFDFSNPVAPKFHQPETGWYWNPDEGGRGYAIEVQNDRVFMAMFHYDADGSPSWNVVQGDVSSGRLVRPFELYTGGQSLASVWRGPALVDLAPFTLDFRNPCAGQMQLAGGPVIRLRRFTIDGTELPAGGECRSTPTLSDVPDLGSTSQTMAPGDAVYGTIDQSADADAYRIDLVAGTSYTFDVKGTPSRSGTLADPVLSVHSAAGHPLAGNDNRDATSLEPRIVYTATVSGPHQLRVTSTGGGGTYLLTASGAAAGLSPSTGYTIEAGTLTGRVIGPEGGALTLSLSANGAIGGQLASASGSQRAVTGSVAPDGVATFGFASAGGTITCSAHLASHRVSGSCGTGGMFIATLVPASAPLYLVGGSLSGLAPGASLSLANYGSGAVPLRANGSFWFSTPIARGGAYHLTIAEQPVGQTCSVVGGTGIVDSPAISSIRIVCPAPAAAPADPAPTSAPTPAPTPAPAPAPATPASTCNLLDFQSSLLSLLNQHRANGASCRSAGSFTPAQPLRWSDQLAQAATGHSIDMAAKNYFSHASLDGRSLVDRINATGYRWQALGENIAAGYPGASTVVDAWMASDGHCANIMNAAYQEVGLACVATSTSTYGTYWTMNAGKPR